MVERRVSGAQSSAVIAGAISRPFGDLMVQDYPAVLTRGRTRSVGVRCLHPDVLGGRAGGAESTEGGS